VSNGWATTGDMIRILVVDDSVIVRKTLSLILSREPDMEVVGAARNGKEALEMVSRGRPDVVLLDVIMPGMNGLETLERLRETDPDLPIIMFSSITHEGAAVTVEALSKGANDYVAKPSAGPSKADTFDTIREELVPKIRLHHLAQGPLPAVATAKPASLPPATSAGGRWQPAIIAIGVSTGGPAALDLILTQLPASFPLPIVIVQHMPASFTKVLAERLDSRSSLKVMEAIDGQELRAGLVVIARGGLHMTVERPAKIGVIRINDGPEVNSCRPSVDVLFESIATAYGGSSLALVLTGMGSDGVAGCERLYRLGGKIIVQDAASSVVWGMPGNVFRAGLAHRVVPLDKMVSAMAAALSL
jgi:two-component system, chemotaxis family, protein-glutamate methylesterase/glutaminase